jgi:hypothetical protein
MPATSVNYLAVLVSAIAVFLVGAVWYSPLLFGKMWVEEHGFTPEKVAAMRAVAGRAYSVSFLCYLVMAFVMALLVAWTGVTTPEGGSRLGAVVWLGFAATIGLTASMFSEKPITIFLLDAGYQLVYLMIMGTILAAWR